MKTCSWTYDKESDDFLTECRNVSNRQRNNCQYCKNPVVIVPEKKEEKS